MTVAWRQGPHAVAIRKGKSEAEMEISDTTLAMVYHAVFTMPHISMIALARGVLDEFDPGHAAISKTRGQCPRCKGVGELVAMWGKQRCTDCNGKGTVAI